MSVVIPANATQVSILQIANGGTGESDAADAINALVPTQTGQSGKFLGTNGTVASWQAAGAAGSVTAVNGTTDEIDVVTTGTVAVVSMDAAYIGQASITTVGTIATGTWQGTTIGSGYGGTGINNGSFTITLGGNLATSGAFNTTLTVTGATGVTLPTSGTLATTSQIPAAANPSASLGLSAVNGSAATFLRSDGAPALSQSIVPTWTGIHTFGSAAGGGTTDSVVISNTEPGLCWHTTGAASNAKSWEVLTVGNFLLFRTIDDANSTVSDILVVTRSGKAVTDMSFGNATDNPTTEFLGTGTVSIDGPLSLPNLTASTGTALIENGDVVYSLTSSREYKVDIEDANEAALANVLKLRPVWYRSNPEKSSDRPDFSWYGLIAEEVHDIDPRLVNYWNQDGVKPKSVGYERIAPLLIPHINRLYERIEELETKLKAVSEHA